MSSRTRLILAIVAFACLALGVSEGRLFDPAVPVDNDNDNERNDNDNADADDEASGRSTAVAVDAAASKIASLVESSKRGSMCEHIRPDELPEECICSEPRPFSLVVECVKAFNSTYFNDTVGMKIDLDPCNEDGSKMSLDVTEREHHIDYPIAGIRAGESKNIPIPGLAMIVPGIGNVGLDVAVLIIGNPDMLKLKIGLNACAQTSTDHQVCASSIKIPGISNVFPWYILQGNYSFGDVCGSDVVVVDGLADGDDEDDSATTILAE